MKTSIKYIGILFCIPVLFLRCEKENLDIPAPEEITRENGKAIVSFQPTFSDDVLNKTDYIPMSRAKDTIKTKLLKAYYAIVIKKTASKWIIDTVIKGQLSSKEYTILVYDNIDLPPIKLALRPGVYKVGFLFNANSQDWNPKLKPGFVVSEKDDISPDDSLPYAYTYLIQEDASFQDLGHIMLNYEPFAAWSSFTINKNDTLHDAGAVSAKTLQLKRRATRFRFLLQDTVAYIKEVNRSYGFSQSAQSIRFVIKATAETPFCQGLNVLGGGYYPKDSTCLQLGVIVSTDPYPYTSPINGKGYQLSTSSHSTYASYHLLMDEYYTGGMKCTIEITKITARSEDPTYLYDKPIERTFFLNKISSIIFRPSSRPAKEIPDSYDGPTLYLEEVEEDGTSLFHPYYELNT